MSSRLALLSVLALALVHSSSFARSPEVAPLFFENGEGDSPSISRLVSSSALEETQPLFMVKVAGKAELLPFQNSEVLRDGSQVSLTFRQTALRSEGSVRAGQSVSQTFEIPVTGYWVNIQDNSVPSRIVYEKTGLVKEVYLSARKEAADWGTENVEIRIVFTYSENTSSSWVLPTGYYYEVL